MLNKTEFRPGDMIRFRHSVLSATKAGDVGIVISVKEDLRDGDPSKIENAWIPCPVEVLVNGQARFYGQSLLERV